jgi:hypothetical protein
VSLVEQDLFTFYGISPPDFCNVVFLKFTWGGVPFKRNVTSLCNLPCPGDDDDRCGSLEKPSSESEIILTVYIYVQEQIGKYTIDLIYWWLLTSREHLY